MSWKDIWAAISGLLSGLKDKTKWKMSIDGVANAPITDVTVSEKGIRFAFEQNGTPVTLEAIPGDAKHAIVKVNGMAEADARLVFSLRHQPLKPLIVVFEFKNVLIDGKTSRYRFDNPK